MPEVIVGGHGILNGGGHVHKIDLPERRAHRGASRHPCAGIGIAAEPPVGVPRS